MLYAHGLGAHTTRYAQKYTICIIRWSDLTYLLLIIYLFRVNRVFVVVMFYIVKFFIGVNGFWLKKRLGARAAIEAQLP